MPPTDGDKQKDQDAVRPGQLWLWDFHLRDVGTWFLDIVSENRRSGYLDVNNVVAIVRGNVFLIVTIDDRGPMQVPDYQTFYESGTAINTKRGKRWHVVLLNNRLAWMDHEHLDVCQLIGQA